MFSQEQRERLFTHGTVPGNTLALVSWTYGLRASEATALTWDGIDMESRTILITRAKSSRTLIYPIPPRVSRALSELRGFYAARPACRFSIYVFTHGSSEANQPLNRCTIWNRWKDHARDCGVIWPSLVKDPFRRDLADHLAACGFSLPQIASALGHKSTHTTDAYISARTLDARQLAIALDLATPAPATTDPNLALPYQIRIKPQANNPPNLTPAQIRIMLDR